MMTMIARVVDGLPLVATMQEDEQSGKSVLEYQNQAKMLFRKLGPNSPTRCSIETGPNLFHYLIENEVCYLVLCDKMFSKRIAFNYLEDIAQEFHNNYGRKVNSATRPYAFIEFDIYIQKAKKSLTDRRRIINTINTQLQDMQRIMVQNIDDVLQRGTVLSELDTKTQNLSMLSQKYKKDATYLNRKSLYVKGAVAGIVIIVFILYFWII
ncbi:vesicle-trafficking protein SEC22b-like [Uranotaenia lowii]|uniref:vesicle-trafficking protein SEC22b-like n=1 Tax=Uranotaenia lowii TaxID=190385 RepID=UPI00247A73B6|nr:vesicle-trafficking protein SEC22b-like [Uranotaenia lowii]